MEEEPEIINKISQVIVTWEKQTGREFPKEKLGELFLNVSAASPDVDRMLEVASLMVTSIK